MMKNNFKIQMYEMKQVKNSCQCQFQIYMTLGDEVLASNLYFNALKKKQFKFILSTDSEQN